MTNETLQPSPVRVLERPTGDRIFGGVAAALARRLDIGVGWVRTAFIVLSFFGGLGIALYAIGWCTIRGEGEDESIAERAFSGLEGGSAWIGGAMMVVAAMVLVGWFGILSGEIVFAAGLFVAGLLIYQGRFPRAASPSRPRAPRPPPAPSTPEAPAGGDETHDALAQARAEVDAETHRVDFGTLGDPVDLGDPADLAAAPEVARPMPVAPPPPPPPPRPRSILGTLAASAMLITMGVMAFLDRLDIVESDPVHYLGALVLISGIALVIGAWYGRARGLILLAVFLAPVAVVAGAIDEFPFGGEFGDVSFRPATVAELPESIERGGGQLTVDLADLDPLVEADRIAIDMGVGEIRVIVPRNLDVVVDAAVGVGNIEAPDGDTNWLDVERTVTFDGDGATLHVDAELGVGNIQILRENR